MILLLKRNEYFGSLLICPVRNSSLLFHFKCCLLLSPPLYLSSASCWVVHTEKNVSSTTNTIFHSWTTTLTISLAVFFSYLCACYFCIVFFLLKIILCQHKGNISLWSCLDSLLKGYNKKKCLNWILCSLLWATWNT